MQETQSNLDVKDEKNITESKQIKKKKLREPFTKYSLANEDIRKQKRKIYRLNNKEKIKACKKKYRLANKGKIKGYPSNTKEKIKARGKKYRLANQPKRNAYITKKRKTDLKFCITHKLRTRFSQALNGKVKSKRTLELLGCSPGFLIQHLEKQFKPGMNWQERHLFHIDHIRPCASFDLTIPEQQDQCFHYSNLQPLWANENFSKGAKW